jgi:16S rRNA (adenine1518-N6/adenine1519-N6)-dimethyltransferase
MRARRRFGQNFLHDPAVIERIVEAIAPAPGEALLEIGPGRGALTALVLQRSAALDAVEIDRDLATMLRTRWPASAGLTLHECDALDFDYAALAAARGRKLRVYGNLPYNISTPLLFRLLDTVAVVADMHFMLQKEVVDRIVAAPGSDAYGRLGVMLAPRLAATRLMEIGPGAFRPAPQVRSAVVRLLPRPQPPAWALDARYGRVVAAAFGQRRKTLRNALAPLLDATAIAAAGVDPGARAETLAPEQFGALARALGAADGGQ